MRSFRVCDGRGRESNVYDAPGGLQIRYEEAAEAYEEGLKTSPGDQALGRGLEDVLKAQAASRAPPGKPLRDRPDNLQPTIVFIWAAFLYGSCCRVSCFSLNLFSVIFFPGARFYSKHTLRVVGCVANLRRPTVR